MAISNFQLLYYLILFMYYYILFHTIYNNTQKSMTDQTSLSTMLWQKAP